MKKTLLILILVLACGLLSLIYFQAQLLKEGKKFLEESISKEINLKITLGEVLIDWAKVLRLSPSIKIIKFKLNNPEGFHLETFASAAKIYAELDLWKLLQKEINIKSIVIDQAEIIIEENSSGKRNSDIVIYELTKKPSPITLKLNKQKPSKKHRNAPLLEFNKLSLDKITIKNSYITSTSYKSGSRVEVFKLENINLISKNFATDKSSTIDIDLNTMGASFKYSGEIGPFSDTDLPSKGVLNCNWKILNIKKELRKKIFGDLLLHPESSDQLNLGLQTHGNLLESINGLGSIQINNVHIGKEAERQLSLDGSLPISVNIKGLQKQQSIFFSINKSKLAIGKNSEILFDLQTRIQGSNISGNLDGSIKGVDINNIVSALSNYRDKIHGKFQVPNLSLSFNGYDSKSISQSSKGKGLILIEDGDFELIETILKAKEIITQLTQKNPSQKTQNLNRFTKISLPLIIENKKVQSDKIEILSPIANIYGSGYFGFDNQIAYKLQSNILGRAIPIEVAGTFEKPKVSFKIEEVLKEELNKQLDNWLNKLNEYQLKRKQLSTP